MKMLVVNFSISNGGDYLIENRMNHLMEKTFPNADIEFFNGAMNEFKGNFDEYVTVVGGWTVL